MLLNLMPAAWRPYAKAVLTAAGAILAVLPQVIPALPEAWQAGLSGFVLAATPVVVWLTQNVPAEELEPAGEEFSDAASEDEVDED